MIKQIGWIPVVLGAQELDGILRADVQFRGLPLFVSLRIS